MPFVVVGIGLLLWGRRKGGKRLKRISNKSA
jgi:hypothetical protein